MSAKSDCNLKVFPGVEIACATPIASLSGPPTATENPPETEALDDQRPWLVALAARSPWWVVSAVFHVLVVALIGVATLSIERGDGEALDAWSSDDTLRGDLTETPSLDSAPTDIVIPPDILARAELGDHFETINPNRQDSHEPLGRAAAEIFHSIHGRDDEFGGGKIEPDVAEIQVGAGGEPCPGSGWGGGSSGGTGVDIGGGSGSFGVRGSGRRIICKRTGCGFAMNSSTELALEWLAKHQDADGHWDAIKNGADFKNDTAVTGLALLSILGAGHTEKVGQYKDNVKRAVGWLAAHQDDAGRIFDSTDAGSYRDGDYPQAIVTMALCEAAGMANRPETRATAQKAIDYCVKCQSAAGGWRYHPGEAGDLSVTAWHIMALKLSLSTSKPP